ncbi:hypothetical protein Plim_3785 [Planctopirus limnophila DSM 3776]|uniref:Uncharacterized protein n=1 Tax=Planctopirus limnophila (strain ATCC 43296 / DSM 3776 / IFAM 1008 / Mu 290) TaxID=521674 RepID=D5SWK4_PLAL2|nr:hypothetical protein [Planctopirus limnophila]ADG69597.1 hypothetical protein Plim_3785 [Planctopirus limnophila DSM 3776]
MKRTTTLLILGLLISGGTSSHLRAEVVPQSAPVVKMAAAPNAAVIYWQAFYAIPNLTEEQKKVLEAAISSDEAPVSDQLKPIFAQYRIALHEMQRARQVTPCDWQLDMSAGPELLLPHVQKLRELSRVSLLRARQRFAEGENDAAIDDVLATLKMARDCASSPLLISILVNASIEKAAIDLLARQLPALTKDQRDRLEKELALLPPTVTVATAMQWEGEIFGTWLKRKLEAEIRQQGNSPSIEKLFAALCLSIGVPCNLDPKPEDREGQRRAELIRTLSIADIHAQIDQLSDDFNTLAQIASLPIDQRKAKVDAFEKSIEAAKQLKDKADLRRCLTITALPSIGNVITREEQLHIRRQLLEQALRVLRDGENSLTPIDGKMVRYQKMAHGFELHLSSSSGDVILKVGTES